MQKSFWPSLFVGSMLLLFGGVQSEAQSVSSRQLYELAQRTFRNQIRVPEAVLRNPEAVLDRLTGEPGGSLSFPVSARSGAETNLSETGEAESEIHAAINPFDTSNIIVGAMLQEEDPFLGIRLSFPVYYTKDFGQTWQKSSFSGVDDLPPLSFVAGGGDPILVFDQAGTAYLSWLVVYLQLGGDVRAELLWARSTDGGANWMVESNPIDGDKIDISLGGGSGIGSGRFVDKEWMSSDLNPASAYYGNIYVSYTELNIINDSTATYRILVKRKPVSEPEFGAEAAVVSTPENALVQFTSIDVDRQGGVHLLFAIIDENGSGLYYSGSGDGGQTFSQPVKISDFYLPCFPPGGEEEPCVTGIDPNRMYPCPHLRVDHSGGDHDGNLYAVWTASGLTNDLNNGLDIYYSRSLDGGLTWSPATVLNQDGLAGNEQFFPSLSVNDQGTVAVSWYDRREDPANLQTNYYLTYSFDGGASFEGEQSVTAAPADFEKIGTKNMGFGVGEYTQVVTTSHYAIPFWADGRSNDGNIEIFSALIPIQGLTVGVEEISTVSTLFSLQGPSPNPVRESSQITLELKEASPVSAMLFDAEGKMLRTFFQTEQLPSGMHTFTIGLQDLPAGIYHLRVDTDFGFRTRRLVKAR